MKHLRIKAAVALAAFLATGALAGCERGTADTTASRWDSAAGYGSFGADGVKITELSVNGGDTASAVRADGRTEELRVKTDRLFYQGLYYKYSVVNPQKSAELVGTAPTISSELVVPSTALGMPVTGIGRDIFVSATSMKSLTIPAGVTHIARGAFEGCLSLKSVTVEEGNPVYHSANNCIIETATGTLVAGLRTGYIPEDGSVRVIGEEAFALCLVLEGISIPASVTSIDRWAFLHCNNLRAIAIYGTSTAIGEGAFRDCSSLEYIEFKGTMDEWRALPKSDGWDSGTPDYVVSCTDGALDKNGDPVD